MWYRVIRYPQAFSGLMDDQRTPIFWGVITSQVWINIENGKMTLPVGEEKTKFDLHQRKPLTDEEMRACKKLESSFSLIKEQAPVIL